MSPPVLAYLLCLLFNRPRFFFFFFNDTATTEIYTLSLHDALPISQGERARGARRDAGARPRRAGAAAALVRSEEHTSELQSRPHLVFRLLLEKKNREPREVVAG